MFILLVGLLLLASKANSSQISGHGSSAVEFGGNASFTCTVSPAAGVLQVTWQRPSTGEAIENLATFSQQFGEQVNEPYRGKVSFTEKSLNSSSITLRNVTWEDEGCYICAFNVFPEGSKRKQFCVTVQGISKVNTSHIPSNRPTESRQEVFSCSATGKPAPSISWDVSPGAGTPAQAQTSTVSNGDGTVTSSSSITLGIPADWTGTVDCLLNREKGGGQRERVFSFHREEQREHGTHHTALIIALVVFISCIVVSAVAIRHRLKKKTRTQRSDSLII